MIAFEVILNGNKLCDAGIKGLGVLTAILSSTHRALAPAAGMNRLYSPDELTLEVGGLQTDHKEMPGQQMSWARRTLKVGDTIVINIKSLEIVDPPEKLLPDNPEEVVNEAKRRYFEELKKEFGE